MCPSPPHAPDTDASSHDAHGHGHAADVGPATPVAEPVSRLAAGLAHDLNNLLGGLLGVASLLRQKAAVQTDLQPLAAGLDAAGARAIDLVALLQRFAATDDLEAAHDAQVAPLDTATASLPPPDSRPPLPARPPPALIAPPTIAEVALPTHRAAATLDLATAVPAALATLPPGVVIQSTVAASAPACVGPARLAQVVDALLAAATTQLHDGLRLDVETGRFAADEAPRLERDITGTLPADGYVYLRLCARPLRPPGHHRSRLSDAAARPRLHPESGLGWALADLAIARLGGRLLANSDAAGALTYTVILPAAPANRDAFRTPDAPAASGPLDDAGIPYTSPAADLLPSLPTASVDAAATSAPLPPTAPPSAAPTLSPTPSSASSSSSASPPYSPASPPPSTSPTPSSIPPHAPASPSTSSPTVPSHPARHGVLVVHDSVIARRVLVDALRLLDRHTIVETDTRDAAHTLRTARDTVDTLFLAIDPASPPPPSLIGAWRSIRPGLRLILVADPHPAAVPRLDELALRLGAFAQLTLPLDLTALQALLTRLDD